MRVSTHLPTAARTVLGLVFFVFGLNGFFHFLPQPPMPTQAMGFVGGLVSAPYFFPVLKGTEVLAALALLSNRFVPLALTLLAPIIVQIVLFHTFLVPSAGMSILLLVTEIYLAWSYRDSFRPMLRSDARPVRAAAIVERREFSPAE
jgi:hypothetical protein